MQIWYRCAILNSNSVKIEYILDKQTGPEHDKTFEVSLYFNGDKIGFGIGKNKKQAEQMAAKYALENVKKDALVIDLASNPGGVDRNAIKEKKIKFIWALSLPGKVAPVTSAEFIKDTLYNIFNEIKGE